MNSDQARIWQGEFGKEYTDRNPRDVDELNEHYKRTFGIERTVLNDEIIGSLSKSLSVLEVGCNAGAQLMALQSQGFLDLTGVEVQDYAVRKAKQTLPDVKFARGSALHLPFEDGAFELVFTSGVLIHISPENLGAVLDEIHRVSRRFIWGWEYCSEAHVEVQYRGRENMLWKANFAQLYMQHFPTLELCAERRVPYLANDNEDSMFLLEKKYT